MAQLLDVGFSPRQIERRLRTGWLTRLHEGVYALGTIGAIGKVQAGLFACGTESMAQDESSAALHHLLPYPDAVYVAVPRSGPRPPGLRTSHPLELPDWTRRHGLKTATIPETLLQLAARSPGLAREATDQAFIHRRTDATALTRFLEAKGSRRGVRALREIIEGPRTRSRAEKTFYRLLERAELPLPLTNVKVNGHLVDFFWPQFELIVETDGWGSHGRRGQWERDRARDLDHAAVGAMTLRVTARMLEREPFAVVAKLSAAMQRRGASGLPRVTAAS